MPISKDKTTSNPEAGGKLGPEINAANLLAVDGGSKAHNGFFSSK